MHFMIGLLNDICLCGNCYLFHQYYKSASPKCTLEAIAVWDLWLFEVCNQLFEILACFSHRLVYICVLSRLKEGGLFS